MASGSPSVDGFSRCKSSPAAVCASCWASAIALKRLSTDTLQLFFSCSFFVKARGGSGSLSPQLGKLRHATAAHPRSPRRLPTELEVELDPLSCFVLCLR